MNKLLEENETFNANCVCTGSPTAWTDSPIHKPKFSSKNPAKNSIKPYLLHYLIWMLF